MSNDPIRILKADHREVEKLLDRLADSAEGVEREQMVEELETNWAPTWTPKSRSSIRRSRPKSAKKTKRKPRSSTASPVKASEKVQQMVDMPGFGAAVEMLKGGIAHHVEEEETQLLPELKERLDRDEWLAIGDALVEAKKAAGLPVPQPPRRKSTKRAKSTKNTKSKARA